MAPLTAIHRSTLPPTGTSHALSCDLTPSDQPQASGSRATSRRLSHLITARKSVLHVYEVLETRREDGTPSARLSHLLTRRFPGTVASLSRVRTLASKHDGCDRVLISFLDAKMSLMEWSPSEHDLVPVSLHTFEKLPQVAEGRPHLISVDPASRLAAMMLPTNTGGDGTLALLPFFSEELDWDSLGMDREGWESSQQDRSSGGQRGGSGGIPYAPSHLLPLATLSSGSSLSAAGAARSSTLGSSSHTGANAFLPGMTSPPIRNIVSMTFLPGFTEPTLALLYAPDWTWSGRLEHLAHNYLVSLVTLSSTNAAAPSGASASPTRAVIIATSPPLPYSCLSITACPATLGGVLLTTSNGILHLDQSGRVVAAPTTAWLARDYPPGRARPVGLDDEAGKRSAEMGEALEGSRVEFFTHPGDDESDANAEQEPTALVWAPSGAVLELSFSRTGRTIAGITIAKVADGSGLTGGAASVLARIGGGAGTAKSGLVFVGSEQGEAGLCRWSLGGGAVEIGQAAVPAIQAEDDQMGMDENEDDIYNTFSLPGMSKSSSRPSNTVAAITNGALSSSAASPTEGRLRLEVCDSLASYGAVRALGVGLVDDESSAELIASTGAGKSAGFTVFHRTLSVLSRRDVHLSSSQLSATEGMWKLEAGGEEVWVVSSKEETIICRRDPSSPELSLEQIHHLPTPTLSSGVLSYTSSTNSSTTPVLILTHRDSLSAYSFPSPSHPPQLLQTLSFPHGAAHPSAHPPHVTFSSSGSHMLLHVAAASGARGKTRPVLYRLEEFPEGNGAIAFVEVAAGGKSARSAVFFDALVEGPLVRPLVASAGAKSGANGSVAAVDAMDEDEDDLYGGGAGAKETKPVEVDETKTVESRFVQPDGAAGGWEWFAEVDAKGDLTIRLADTLVEIFSSAALCLLPPVLSDGITYSDRPIPSTVDVDDLKVDRILLSRIGPHGQEKIHLLVLLTNGTLAVYEAFPAELESILEVAPLADDSSTPPAPRLALRFVKTLVRHLPSIALRRKGASPSDLPPPRRDFLLFSNVGGHSGMFVTGEEAMWLLKDGHGSVEAHESAERGVYSFAETGDGGFAMQTREGLQNGRLPPSLSLSTSLAFTHVPKNRVYNHFAFDLEAGLYVAATLNETAFMAFDDDGNPLFKEQEVPGLVAPHNYQSTLEVIVPGSWEAVHGYEFRQNEFVTALKSVSLASKSRASGQRDFLAVGTAVYRGEDLATRGGLYLFELVRVNAHPSSPKEDHVLRLLFFEDCRAVVSNVCDLNGYLFLSMGQKLYGRAFEQDEFLLSVGFLDVGVHVTSLQAMKNFLLIGDAVQSLALVAFQEDPYKLVLLGRDYRPVSTSSGNFLINDGKVAFISGDDQGVLRLFEYDPSNIASHAGQRLLCRTEYFAGSEAPATMLFAKHLAGEDAKQNGILYGGLDGSLSTLVPVRDAVFKRLQSLQSLMSRHVLHFGGLNPRAHRTVKNDEHSRPLIKGILDGDVLATFEYLSVDLQTDLAEAAGSDADTIRANVRSLRGWE